MLELLASPPGIVAMRFSGKFDHDDVEQAKSFFERPFAPGETINVFIEVDSFTGVDLKEMPGYIASAAPFLTRLEHLDRVAVVSDAAWLRSLARFEGALLPHVHYETFASAERDQAWAWVEGRASLPHGSSMTLIESNVPNVVGFGIDGRPSAVEMKAVVDYFEGLLQPNQTLRVLGRLRRFDGSSVFGGILNRELVAVKRRSLSQVERLAIVGGPDWLTGLMSLVDPVLKIEIRHFDLADEAAAWAWLGASPMSERPAHQ